MSSATPHAALEAAHTFYGSQLAGSWAAAAWTGRGLDPALMQVGYAPPGRTATSDHLRAAGFSDAVLLEAGILRRTRAGGLRDAITDRLTVPIRRDDTVVGFTARTGGERPDPDRKWINTSTTDLFSKRNTLLTDPRGQRPSPHSVPILAEGAADVAALAQATARIDTWAAAPCGTALTAEHVDQIYRSTGPTTPIMVAFDNDRAGQAATMRAWDMLTADPRHRQRQLLAVPLKAGMDPGDYLARGHTAALRRNVLGANLLAETVADLRIGGVHASDHRIRAIAAAQHLIGEQLHKVYPGSQTRYLDHLADRLGLDRGSIRQITVDQIGVEASTTDMAFTSLGHRAVDAVPAPARPTRSLTEPRSARSTR